MNNTTEPIGILRDSITTNTLIKGSFLLLLRAGFLLIQLGTIPTQDVYEIIIQNLADVSVSIISFCTIGYTIAYGEDVNGMVGKPHFSHFWDMDPDKAVFGICVCVISSAIMTSMTAGRILPLCYLLVTFFSCAILLPFYIHWIWTQGGWMANDIFLAQSVSLRDRGGALAIHLSATIGGMICAMILGRRIIRLGTLSESSISFSAPSYTFLGYFLVIIGLIAFASPTVTYLDTSLNGVVTINYLIAFSGGCLAMLVITAKTRRRNLNYWMILRCVQGGVAGMVCVTAGVFVYMPLVAFLIASLGGVLFYFCAYFLNSTLIEDYSNIIAIHGITAFVGVLFPPLVGGRQNLGFTSTPHKVGVDFLWQIIGLLLIVLISGLFYAVLYCSFFYGDHLRNDMETESFLKREELGKLGFRSFLNQFFRPQKNVLYFEPGAVSKQQINRVMERIGADSESLSWTKNFPKIQTSTTLLSTKRKSDKKKKIGFS